MYFVVSCVYSCIILQVSITQFHNCMHVCVCVCVFECVLCVFSKPIYNTNCLSSLFICFII